MMMIQKLVFLIKRDGVFRNNRRISFMGISVVGGDGDIDGGVVSIDTSPTSECFTRRFVRVWEFGRK